MRWSTPWPAQRTGSAVPACDDARYGDAASARAPARRGRRGGHRRLYTGPDGPAPSSPGSALPAAAGRARRPPVPAGRHDGAAVPADRRWGRVHSRPSAPARRRAVHDHPVAQRAVARLVDRSVVPPPRPDRPGAAPARRPERDHGRLVVAERPLVAADRGPRRRLDAGRPRSDAGSAARPVWRRSWSGLSAGRPDPAGRGGAVGRRSPTRVRHVPMVRPGHGPTGPSVTAAGQPELIYPGRWPVPGRDATTWSCRTSPRRRRTTRTSWPPGPLTALVEVDLADGREVARRALDPAEHWSLQAGWVDGVTATRRREGVQELVRLPRPRRRTRWCLPSSASTPR